MDVGEEVLDYIRTYVRLYACRRVSVILQHQVSGMVTLTLRLLDENSPPDIYSELLLAYLPTSLRKPPSNSWP